MTGMTSGLRAREALLAFAAAMSLWSPRLLHSQAPPPLATITTSVDLVLVPALVHSSSGERIESLHASDFLLTDNGEPQSVRLEDTDKQPLAVVVLLQTGGSGPRHFADYAKLGTMFESLVAGVPHEIAMVAFDSRPEEQWDFTPYIADLQDGFVHPGGGDRKAAILDAVNHGIDLLQKQPLAYRRVLVLISQGHDEGSTTTAEQVMERLGENNITIESVNFSPEKDWLKDQFTQGRQENKLYRYGADGPLLLHTFNLSKPFSMALGALRENTSAALASLSGGEALAFATRPELEKQLSTLANDLAATVTLSFHPSVKEPGFHALRVQMNGHPELSVSARTGYWAAASPQSSQ